MLYFDNDFMAQMITIMPHDKDDNMEYVDNEHKPHFPQFYSTSGTT